MSVFIDLYFGREEKVDRVTIQEALEAELEGVVSVVGSGVGQESFNLDLEVANPTRSATTVRDVAGVLRRLGVREDTIVAVSHPPRKLELGSIPAD